MASNFVNRSISFFANKKKILIISLSIIILFIIGFIYNSYATSTGLSLGNDENTYDILLTDSTNTVTVPAKSSKTVYYQFNNTNKGTIKYHIGYTSNNVIAKVWWDTEDPISGTIEYGEYKFIKLKLINDTTSDDTITIKPVLGFKDGGDVIPDSNTTLVTGTIKQTNTWDKTVPVDKSKVKEIHFVNDNIVPDGVLGSGNGNADGSIKTWYTVSDTDELYNVYIGSDNGITSFPSDSSSLFKLFTKMSSVNLNNIDTSNVTDMSNMFSNCSNLTTLDLSDFNTSSITSMSYMFSNCSNLTTLDLSNFDTSNVTDMSYMFSNCSNLTTLDLSNFNTSSVTSMEHMFYSCDRLTNLNLSGFNTSKVTTMENMFEDCYDLTTLDLSCFDTSNVNTMKGMFSKCQNLTTLDLSNFNTSNVTNMAVMFHYCSKLTVVDLSNFDTSNVENMRLMFSKCGSLTTLDLSSFHTPSVTNTSQMFDESYNLNIIDMRNADLSGVSSYSNTMFSSVSTSATIYLKDTQGNRDFMSNNFSRYTNVQYIPSS